MSLAEELLKSFKRDVDELVLVPTDGGAFEIEKNGTLLFSKLSAERFPDDGEVMEIFMGRKEPVGAA